MALGKSPAEIVASGDYPLLEISSRWERVKLGEIATVQNGAPFSSEYFTHGEGMPLIRIRDVHSDSTENFYSGPYDEEFVVRKGDILIGMDGDFDAGIWKGAAGLLNQRVCRLTLTTKLYSREFLFLALQPYLNAINAETSSVTVKHLSSRTIADIPLPLPPLAEQKRIVAKIEELFSELEAGEESLRVARRQLGVYRQSLLKQAFEGKLTKKWRTENSAKLESPAQLLSRIREARSSLGTHASKAPLEILDRTRQTLPAIPGKWHWLRLENLAAIGTGMSVSQARTYEDPIEVPYLRVANVQRGRLDLSEMRTMLVEKSRLVELRLKVGDLLFNEGGDRDKLGRGWVWSGQIDPCITQNHVFRATLVSSLIALPEFVSHWGNAFGQDFFHLTGKQTTNLASISKATLSSLPVPIPPVDEQHEILRLLDTQFEVITQNEREIDAALQRSEALRQAILKKAFTGRLVPQDPSDEPASALLARLRTERAASATSKRKAIPQP